MPLADFYDTKPSSTETAVSRNLFAPNVLIHDAVELRPMLDSGSMVCSLNSRLLPLLEEANVLSPNTISPTSVVIGCGGLRKSPIGVFDCHISVPTFIVDGQSDDLILRSNISAAVGHSREMER